MPAHLAAAAPRQPSAAGHPQRRTQPVPSKRIFRLRSLKLLTRHRARAVSSAMHPLTATPHSLPASVPHAHPQRQEPCLLPQHAGRASALRRPTLLQTQVLSQRQQPPGHAAVVLLTPRPLIRLATRLPQRLQHGLAVDRVLRRSVVRWQHRLVPAVHAAAPAHSPSTLTSLEATQPRSLRHLRAVRRAPHRRVAQWRRRSARAGRGVAPVRHRLHRQTLSLRRRRTSWSVPQRQHAWVAP